MMTNPSDQHLLLLQTWGYRLDHQPGNPSAWRSLHPNLLVPAFGPFPTKEQAISAAWADAAEEGRAFAQISANDWQMLPVSKQQAFIEEALNGG